MIDCLGIVDVSALSFVSNLILLDCPGIKCRMLRASGSPNGDGVGQTLTVVNCPGMENISGWSNVKLNFSGWSNVKLKFEF